MRHPRKEVRQEHTRWQTRNYLSFIYLLEPIRESLAWKRKILGQRKIGYIALKPEHLIYVIAQPMGLLARFKADPPLKHHRLSSILTRYCDHAVSSLEAGPTPAA
ncbi:MAG: hypothetical protein ACXWT4_18955 [Methylobacter sp.]